MMGSPSFLFKQPRSFFSRSMLSASSEASESGSASGSASSGSEGSESGSDASASSFLASDHAALRRPTTLTALPAVDLGAVAPTRDPALRELQLEHALTVQQLRQHESARHQLASARLARRRGEQLHALHARHSELVRELESAHAQITAMRSEHLATNAALYQAHVQDEHRLSQLRASEDAERSAERAAKRVSAERAERRLACQRADAVHRALTEAKAQLAVGEASAHRASTELDFLRVRQKDMEEDRRRSLSHFFPLCHTPLFPIYHRIYISRETKCDPQSFPHVSQPSFSHVLHAIVFPNVREASRHSPFSILPRCPVPFFPMNHRRRSSPHLTSRFEGALREAREVERAQNEQLRVLGARLVQVGTRDPFSLYVAPRFPHMSEMNSSF